MKIKTFDTFNEGYDNSNFGFHSSLENLKILINDLLKIDSFKLNKTISENEWIFDSISKAETDINKVYDFLLNELKSNKIEPDKESFESDDE